jgi:hypothetical protein
LADKFRFFSPSQNKELVEYIQSVCPTAFREYEERVQIVVDNMDIITFKQVLQYLMSYFRKSEEIEEKEKEEGYPSKKVKV